MTPSSADESTPDAAAIVGFVGEAPGRIHPAVWMAIGVAVFAAVFLLSELLGLFNWRTPVEVATPSIATAPAMVVTQTPVGPDSNGIDGLSRNEWEGESAGAGVADAVPLATELAKAAASGRLHSIPRDDGNSRRKVDAIVFDTAGRTNSNGIKMRMSFPRTWKAEEGAGHATVQRFIAAEGRGNPSILVQTFARDAPFDRPLTESEKQFFLAREQTQEAFGNESKILSHAITTLDGEMCAVFELEQVLDAGGFKVAVRSICFAVPHARAGLLITCYVQGDASAGLSEINREYEAAKPLFMEIANSCDFADAGN